MIRKNLLLTIHFSLFVFHYLPKAKFLVFAVRLSKYFSIIYSKMPQNIINSQQRFCYKCHRPAGNADAKCARCGGVLRTKTTIRILGGVLVFLGGFVSALMAFVAVFMYGALVQTDGRRFSGTETELLFAVGIIGLTFVVGVSFALAGVWQIIFGRRNTIIVWISVGLVIVLFVIGKIFVAMTR
jgi:uncharacterized paraquat-inducible protein A